MQTVLCQMAGSTPESSSAAPDASGPALDESRLTCSEYVAFITAQVVQNMDAIAWARVNRKARRPELDQHLQILGDGEGSKQKPTGDEHFNDDTSSIMSMPGLLRQVEFPFDDLQTAFAYAEELGTRNDFAQTLNDFLNAQQMTLAEELDWTSGHDALTPFWRARANSVVDVQSACAALRSACEDPDFVGDCIRQQSRIIQEAQKECHQDNDEDDLLETEWGVAQTSLDSVLPQG